MTDQTARTDGSNDDSFVEPINRVADRSGRVNSTPDLQTVKY